jgi:large subunit ribosomal protein L1
MQRSKTYRAASESIDHDALYSPLAAIKLAKSSSKKKFDETVDVAMRLGVDPRKADQMVRGTVNLPHGTGKTARVLVFASGDRAEAAREAGADIVGSDELIEEVQKGRLDFDAVVATPDLMGKVGRLGRVLVFATGERAEQARAAGADIVGDDALIDEVNKGRLDFDAVVATPDMMGKVGRLGRVLGPRGLMPNPKTGTVTPDVAKAVSDIKGGKIEFRVDRHANLHFIIGKASFSETQLAENYAAALEEVLRLKPASSKGRYLKKVTFSTTMGPGVQVDPNKTRNVAAEDEA